MREHHIMKIEDFKVCHGVNGKWKLLNGWRDQLKPDKEA